MAIILEGEKKKKGTLAYFLNQTLPLIIIVQSTIYTKILEGSSKVKRVIIETPLPKHHFSQNL